MLMMMLMLMMVLVRGCCKTWGEDVWLEIKLKLTLDTSKSNLYHVEEVFGKSELRTSIKSAGLQNFVFKQVGARTSSWWWTGARCSPTPSSPPSCAPPAQVTIVRPCFFFSQPRCGSRSPPSAKSSLRITSESRQIEDVLWKSIVTRCQTFKNVLNWYGANWVFFAISDA